MKIAPFAVGCLPVIISLSSLIGCGEPSDRPSEVNTLRVLAVRSETPFTKPGVLAELSMLAYDGSPRATRADGTQRDTSTLWIGGCNNPRGDAYAACMPYLNSVVDNFDNSAITTGNIPAGVSEGTVGWGPTFSAQIPASIIESRPVAPGVTYPYGIQMVFFAHCGGVFRHVSNARAEFPLGCFDSQTGERLGRDDFEYGFYPIFSYNSVENLNPVLTAMRLDNAQTVVEPACSEVNPCTAGYHCSSRNICVPVVAHCTKANVDDCESHALAVDVSRTSVELAIVAHIPESDAPQETLWVSYYASAGSFEKDARIINDPHSGWNDDTTGKWRANTASSQEVRLWAVVRDNRNGVTWSEQILWVE